VVSSRVLGEAAQLAAGGVVPAVARVAARACSSSRRRRPRGWHGEHGHRLRRRGRPRRALRRRPPRRAARPAVGVMLARVAEAILEARAAGRGAREHGPRAPGLRAVGVDAQEIDGAAAVDVAHEDDLVGLELGPGDDAGLGEAAVSWLIHRPSSRCADADEVGRAVAVDVGELPAVGLRIIGGDAGHVGRILEEAEARARRRRGCGCSSA
jgi:hypothetical protein